MKIFKELLAIIVLCACNPMFAKIVTGKGTTKEQITPVTPKGPQITPVTVTERAGTEPTPYTIIQPKPTYATILNQIKTGKTGVKIVNANNQLTPAFIDFIENNARTSKLSAAETEALLQAGANLNVTWSGDQKKDTDTLVALDIQIQKIKASRGEGPTLVETEAKPVPFEILTFMPEYYDTKTNLLNENLMISRISDQLQTKSIAEVTKILRTLYIDKMIAIWNKLNLDEKELLPQLKKQIDMIVSKAERRFQIVESGKITTPDFYDDSTDLLSQSILNAEVLQAIQAGQTRNTITSNLIKKYQDLMIPIWSEKKINASLQGKAMRQQITSTIESIQKEALSIVPYVPEKKPTEIPAPTDMPPKLPASEQLRTTITNLVNKNKVNIKHAYDQTANKGNADIALVMLKNSGIIQAVREKDTSDLAKNILTELLGDIDEYIVPGISSTQAVHTLWLQEETKK